MPSPEVLDGMRQPRSVRMDDIRKNTETLNELPTPSLAPEGVTVYVSSSRGYLVEVKNSRSFVQDGQLIQGTRIAAQFSEGIFRNNHEDPEIRKMIDTRLQKNKYFGKFGGGSKVHFWLASDQMATTKAASIQAALDTLKSVPREQLEARLAELRQGDADDHEFTPAAEARTAQRPTAKPIAS